MLCLRVAIALLVMGSIACGSDVPIEPPPATGSGGSGGGIDIVCGDGEVVAGDACAKVGVPEDACLDGFVWEAGGCRAIVPQQACADGEMALPGDSACRPVSDCGTGKWGNIPQPAGTTLYVDQSYMAMDADGSIDRPYPTISQAVDGAPAGTTIAVTDGEYAEEVLPGRANGAIKLYGRCPSRVAITGTGMPLFGSLELTTAFADGVEVRGFEITSANGFGVTVSGVVDVVLEDLWVHDTLNGGIALDDTVGPTSATVRNVLIQRVRGSGVQARGVTVDIDGIEVREGMPVVAGAAVGLSFIDSPDQPTTATASRANLHDLFGAGIGTQGSSVTFTDSYIHDINPISSSMQDGIGIAITRGPKPELTMRGVVIERVHDAGVFLNDASAVIETTTVRDVRPQVSNNRGGAGFGVSTNDPLAAASMLTVKDSYVARCTGFGVSVVDAVAALEGVWIRETVPFSDNDLFGDGMLVWSFSQRARADVSQVLIEGSSRGGITSFSGDVSIAQSRFSCNAFDLAGEATAEQGDFSFDDQGGNQCGCETLGPCRVSSADLAPPSFP